MQTGGLLVFSFIFFLFFNNRCALIKKGCMWFHLFSSIVNIRKDAKPSTDLEPLNPTLNPPYDSIDHISPQPRDLEL
jgi:hypothetical protein